MNSKKPSHSILPHRLYSLDVARGIAAVSVILWHWQHFFYNSQGQLPKQFSRKILPYYEYLTPFYEHFGILGLYFFFSLSGFVFFWLYQDQVSQKICSFKTFAIARIARLYPLHLLTLIIMLGLQTIHWSWFNSYFVFIYNDLYHFILQLFFLSSWGFEQGYSFNGPIWSVSIEIILYLIFFFLAYFRLAATKYLLIWITGLIIVRDHASGILSYLNLYVVVSSLECFLLGGLTYQLSKKYLVSSWRQDWTDHLALSIAILPWCLLGLYEPFGTYMTSNYNLFARTLLPVLVFALVLSEHRYKLAYHKLRHLGDITYAVYLIHVPLQLIFLLIFKYLGYSSSIFNESWVFILFMMILLPLSWLTYHGFEKPLRAWIRQKRQLL